MKCCEKSRENLTIAIDVLSSENRVRYAKLFDFCMEIQRSSPFVTLWDFEHKLREKLRRYCCNVVAREVSLKRIRLLLCFRSQQALTMFLIEMS